MALDDWLGQLLQRHQPRSLLCCSRVPLAQLEAWAQLEGTALSALSAVPQLAALSAQRFDLALIIDQLGTVDRREGERLLARLRDFHSYLFYVLETGEGAPMPWTPRDFYALGMERLREVGQPGAVYRYDARHYNPKRRWNNPEHWANPERFHRHRW